MKKIIKKAGLVVFWVAWPFWFLYFRVNTKRSRVLVVNEDRLLLVSDWLGKDEWGLPGGGAKRGEAIEVSACRELEEEVGIKIGPDELEYLGQNLHKEAGLKYDAVYFLLRLDKKPDIKTRKKEIAEAGWFNISEAKNIKLNKDARFALTEYAAKV